MGLNSGQLLKSFLLFKRDYLASKMPNIDPDAISIVKPNFARQTSVSTLEKLKDMIEDSQNNDDLELFKSLLLEVGEHDLEKFKSGGHTLLQKACWCRKTNLVQALLDSGMTVNGLADDSKMTPVLISASLGDASTIGKYLFYYFFASISLTGGSIKVCK